MYSIVDEYRAEITAGTISVYVDGYCASLPTAKENMNTAFVRSNRVKSELITKKQLLEEHFVTKNHASAYEGHRDIVIVTLHIPVKEQTTQAEPVKEQPQQESPSVVMQERQQPEVSYPPRTSG